MKLEPIRITVFAAIIACLCGIAFYYIYTNNISEVANKQVSVSTGTGYSEDKNAVHDLLIIFENDKYGFASIEGEILEEAKYDVISLADYGLYYVKSGKTQGFVNSFLQPVFMTEETINTNLSEDFVIYTGDKKSGFINIKTGEKIEAVYDGAYDFSEGYAAVQKNDKVGFVNTKGELVIEHKYYNKGLYYFKSGLCSVRLDDPSVEGSSTFYIDKRGNTVIDDNYQYGMPFYENRTFVMKNGEWYIIDITGARKSENNFGPYDKTIPGRFKGGYATVIEEGKYGVINIDGDYVLQPEYEELAEVNDERIVFKKDGKYGYMTVKGNVIIKPQYDSLSNFKNSAAVFTIDNKYGLIHENGKVVLDAEYEKIEILDNGAIKVYKEGKSYLYTDIKGNIIWESKDKNN